MGRMCVWIRLLFAALTFYGLTIARDYVDQQRYTMIGARNGAALMFDSLMGQFGWLPVPEPPTDDDAMVLPPDVPL